jgi:hypothetical protein
MALHHAYSNHNNAAEYQSSSIPFVEAFTINAGDTQHVNLPYVSRFIVISTNVELKLGFSSAGVAATNYFIVKAGTSPRLEIKCREFWLNNSTGGAATASVLVGVTNIPYSQFPDLTGIEGVGGP